METRNGTTGNSDEHQRPDWFFTSCRIKVCKRNFHHRAFARMNHCRNCNADCHKNQTDTENRIKASNNFINRKQCCKEIINKNDYCPGFYIKERITSSQLCKKSSRSYHKYNTNHYKQYQTKNTHDILHCLAHVLTSNFCNTCTVIANRKHSRHIVMNTTGQNCTEYNPQVNTWSPHST